MGRGDGTSWEGRKVREDGWGVSHRPGSAVGIDEFAIFQCHFITCGGIGVLHVRGMQRSGSHTRHD